jgi:hypothetical protein
VSIYMYNLEAAESRAMAESPVKRQIGAKKVLLLVNISFPACQLASESIYGHRGRDDPTVEKKTVEHIRSLHDEEVLLGS